MNDPITAELFNMKVLTDRRCLQAFSVGWLVGWWWWCVVCDIPIHSYMSHQKITTDKTQYE